jgi:Na+/proline symporter/nitrogen-specific signal transduction histidine kinase
MNSGLLLLILLFYLGLLFFIAQWAERKGNSKWTNNPYVYSLSLAVYCTTWTYYGSIGVAANSGLNYIPIYLGPVIAFPAWIVILKKIIRISRINKIASIADFISLRYGNSRFLGALVTVISLVAILPYIGLQLKAISETFHVVTNSIESTNIFEDTSTYVALVLALFASFYGTRYVDASEKRNGIVTAVAMESVLKLFFFILLGLYVTFFVFGGFDEIYTKASVLEGFQERNTINGLEGGMNWVMLIILSFFSIFLLPRQFHMAIVENNREKHIRTAIWLFPLYLLLFNLFVYPIAWGGNIIFENQDVNPDMFSLLIPQHFDNTFLTVLVFLGGFSAAISMIVVSSIALSTMLSNNLVIPYGLLGSLQKEDQKANSGRIVRVRRIGIFLMIILAFIYYRFFIMDFSLVSVGMISFVIVAQLGPTFFGALFWKRGTFKGSVAGILGGMLVCFYTIVLPFLLRSINPESIFFKEDFFGFTFLQPFQLFGLDYLEPIPHALFWSLLVNTLLYLLISIYFKANYRERNYAEMFVDIDKYIVNHENAFVWKGTAYVSDIQKVLKRFLGDERTNRALSLFKTKYNVAPDDIMADARLIKFAENLLTGHIGTASAKILIESVTKEDKISLPEVLKILEESKENLIINKKLTETSKELKELSAQLKTANKTLVEKDKQKDEFLDTVTHELRTPITAIRAASEILHDDEEIPIELKKQFLQNIITESDRLNRLIDKILDLEKFETGKQKLHLSEGNIIETISKALSPLHQLFTNQNITVKFNKQQQFVLNYDEERLIQVITNLVSNAIKFCAEKEGNIQISIEVEHADFLKINVYNNGKGVNPSDLETIFDKFYQSNNQNIKKPVGSGLGLAICKQIIEAHKGKIWATNELQGVTFSFTVPTNLNLNV